MIQIKQNAPLFLLGDFGGYAYDLVAVMGIGRRELPRSATSKWAGLELFKKFGPDHLNNGLTVEENRNLADAAYIDEATGSDPSWSYENQPHASPARTQEVVASALAARR